MTLPVIALLLSANAGNPNSGDPRVFIKSLDIPFWTENHIPTVECDLPPDLSNKTYVQLSLVSNAWPDSLSLELPVRIELYGAKGKVYAPRPDAATLLAFNDGRAIRFDINEDGCRGKRVTLARATIRATRDGQPARNVAVETCLFEQALSNTQGLIEVQLPLTGGCDVTWTPPMRFLDTMRFLDRSDGLWYRKPLGPEPPQTAPIGLHLQSDSPRIQVVQGPLVSPSPHKYDEAWGAFHKLKPNQP